MNILSLNDTAHTFCCKMEATYTYWTYNQSSHPNIKKYIYLLLPVVLFIYLSLDFGGCLDVCFLLNIIELDGTSVHLHMDERWGN